MAICPSNYFFNAKAKMLKHKCYIALLFFKNDDMSSTFITISNTKANVLKYKCYIALLFS